MPIPIHLDLPLLSHHHVFEFGSSIHQRLLNVDEMIVEKALDSWGLIL